MILAVTNADWSEIGLAILQELTVPYAKQFAGAVRGRGALCTDDAGVRVAVAVKDLYFGFPYTTVGKLEFGGIFARHDKADFYTLHSIDRLDPNNHRFI